MQPTRIPENPGSAPVDPQAYRAFVGPLGQYDRSAAVQFTLMILLGLREHHSLLDIGCGSLRGGRLFIPYLLPERYFGIEPEQWLIESGIDQEIGRDVVRIKQPTFSNDEDFTLTAFGREFDYLIAQSIFSHASQKQITRCLSEARKVMHSGSIFAATFREGPSDYTREEWVYPGCSSYRLERMVRLVEEQDLDCRVLNWPHPNQQTWIAIAREEGLAKLPRALCDGDLAGSARELTANLLGEVTHLTWKDRLAAAIDELTAVIPPGQPFILVDEDQWGTREEVAGRRRVPFLEQEGSYWGHPPDDETAIREVTRLRQAGADFMAFAWPAFWWLAHYSRLHVHLRSEYRCVLESAHLVVFDLRPRP